MTELEPKADIQELQPEIPVEAEAPTIDDDQKPVYNKRQVSDVVKREREKAAKKAREEVLMEMQQQQQQAQQQPAAQAAQPQVAPPQTNQLGGMQQLSKDEIINLIGQHAPQALHHQVEQFKNKQFVDSFVSKMQAAEAKYPGLEQKLSELDFSTLHPLIKEVNEMGNAGDIMNELIENPMKMGNLMSLINSNQHGLAKKAIQGLSSSITANTEAASKEKSASEPFGQIKPSSAAGKDDGDMSVSDFKNASWLRG